MKAGKYVCCLLIYSDRDLRANKHNRHRPRPAGAWRQLPNLCTTPSSSRQKVCRINKWGVIEYCDKELYVTCTFVHCCFLGNDGNKAWICKCMILAVPGFTYMVHSIKDLRTLHFDKEKLIRFLSENHLNFHVIFQGSHISFFAPLLLDGRDL